MSLQMHFKFSQDGVYHRFVLPCNGNLFTRMKERILTVMGPSQELNIFWDDGESLISLRNARDLDAAVDCAQMQAMKNDSVPCIKISVEQLQDSSASAALATPVLSPMKKEEGKNTLKDAIRDMSIGSFIESSPHLWALACHLELDESLMEGLISLKLAGEEAVGAELCEPVELAVDILQYKADILRRVKAETQDSPTWKEARADLWKVCAWIRELEGEEEEDKIVDEDEREDFDFTDGDEEDHSHEAKTLRKATDEEKQDHDSSGTYEDIPQQAAYASLKGLADFFYRAGECHH